MRSPRLILILLLATVCGAPAFASTHALHSARPHALFFDAVFTHARSAGPDASHVGHEQIARGRLRDASGRAVGRFHFTCTWTRILAGGDALEHCSGSGRTADGQLDVAGPARASAATHRWKIVGGSGRYQGARGTVIVRDLGSRETLITVSITPQHPAALRVGVIPRPTVNATFLARTDRLCADASAQLATLPPFPLRNFDPLHPDPSVLPQVGAFFTGSGDPRPILHTLNARLQALGNPPADRPAWKRTLDARTAALAVIQEQDNAALAGNVPAFVKTVHDSTSAFRQIAITATIFGATRCVL